MREPLEHPRPGEEVKASLAVRSDNEAIRPGASVEATDGPLGIVRQRATDEKVDHAYICVETDDGLLYVPDRLVRETHGETVMLSLPRADVRAQSARQPRIGQSF